MLILSPNFLICTVEIILICILAQDCCENYMRLASLVVWQVKTEDVFREFSAIRNAFRWGLLSNPS